MTNNRDKIAFTIYVDTENQQRLTLGKQGKNIQEAIDRFKVLYGKMYKR